MNKLVILLLAVCLVSVHGFVKRETEPAKTEDILANIQKQIQDLLASKQLEDAFNPENIKKKFSEVVDDFQKTLNNFKATTEVPKK